MRQGFRWSLGLAVIGSIIFFPGRVMFDKYYNHEVSFKANVEAAVDGNALAQEIMSAKIKGLQDEVIHELEKCENPAGNAALIHYDNNANGTLKGKDIPSLGILQEKIGTIQTYSSQLNGKKLTEKEAIEIGIDAEKSEAIARDIIFRSQGGLWNWSCATPEMGVKVGVIKELMKDSK